MTGLIDAIIVLQYCIVPHIITLLSLNWEEIHRERTVPYCKRRSGVYDNGD